MVGKKSISRILFEIINVILLSFIAFTCLAPVLHVIFSSISDPAHVARSSGIVLWPMGQVHLTGYKMVFRNPYIISGYLNTIFYVVVGTTINVILTAIGGYVCSRKYFLWSNFIMFFIAFSMMFGGGLIPLYMVVRALGLINTRWAVILPTAIQAFNLIIMRTFFETIPDSIAESAKIDGAKELTILFRIILPLSKASVAVVALFYAVFHWNNWFHASVFLQDRDKFPLQLIMREILVQKDTSIMLTEMDSYVETNLYKDLVQYCTIVVGSLPILIIYPFIQKHFEKGVLLGSLKG